MSAINIIKGNLELNKLQLRILETYLNTAADNKALENKLLLQKTKDELSEECFSVVEEALQYYEKLPINGDEHKRIKKDILRSLNNGNDTTAAVFLETYLDVYKGDLYQLPN